MLQIGGVLTIHECEAIAESLTGDALWADGGATAKGAARAAKRNLQADVKAPPVKAALAKIKQSLLANDVFRAAAQPAQIARMILSRYGPGMAYGDHVDAPYIDGVRTDLSFTLFLSDPETYEGGELIAQNAGFEDAVKGPAGGLVLYPSNTVHRVEPVARGERLACIGWVKSRIRSTEQRDLVFEMERLLADLRTAGAAPGLTTRLSNLRNNLLRMFGE